MTLELIATYSSLGVRALLEFSCVLFLIRFSYPTKHIVKIKLVILTSFYILLEALHIIFFELIQQDTLLSIMFFFFHYGKTTVFFFFLFEKSARKIVLFINIIYTVSVSIVTQTIIFCLNAQIQYTALTSSSIINWIDCITIACLLGTAILLRYKSQSFFIVMHNFSSISVKTFVLIVTTLSCLAILENNTLSQSSYSDFTTDVSRISSVFLTILLFVLIIYFMIIYYSKAISERTTTILANQISAQVAHYEAIKDYNNDLLKFRHDYANMMLCLRALLRSNNNIQQALSFIDDMENTFSNERIRFDSGNYIADALLDEKSRMASQYNTKLDFDGFIPSYRINNLDLCVILTNALDNAIEACANIPGEKKIEIFSEIKNSIWFFTIKNPVLFNIYIQNNTITTTKGNTCMHGFGLQNIKQTVKKCGGRLYLSCSDNIFVFDVTVKLK